jgi:predicted PurR-regulated permease PerM
MALTGLAVATIIALVVVFLWGLGRVLNALSPVLWPLAFAGVLAYLLDPVVDYIEYKGATRARAIVLVFLMALVILSALFSSVVPQLVAETRVLVGNIPEYGRRVEKRVEKWLANPRGVIQRIIHWQAPRTNAPTSTNVPAELPSTAIIPPAATTTNSTPILEYLLGPERLQTATDWLTKALPKVGSWLLGQAGRVVSWFGVLAGLALVPVYLFYFLLEKRAIASRWTNYLPVADSQFKEELVFVIGAINNYLIAFFRGQVLVAICDAVLYTIGFSIIGLPYAILLGVLAVFLTIIPYLGAFIICSTALVIALVQFGDWLHPLLVLLVFAVVQGLEGLVIAPRIMGERVGLHPVTIIIAVVIGTALLGGLLGGILAIPLTAALRVLMFRYVWTRPVQEST